MANGHGGRRAGAGRKSKAEEQRLIERLTPLAPTAHRQLKAAIDAGEQWAIKLFFEYMYGKPMARTQLDHTTGGEKLNGHFPSFEALRRSIFSDED